MFETYLLIVGQQKHGLYGHYLVILPLLHLNVGVDLFEAEQEEYDEIVQIKAMFLNHDYQ